MSAIEDSDEKTFLHPDSNEILEFLPQIGVGDVATEYITGSNW